VNSRPQVAATRGLMNASYPSKPLTLAAGLGAAIALLFAFEWPSPGASQQTSASAQPEQPLPTRIVIDVNAPGRDLYRIAVPNLLGSDNTLGTQGAEVVRNDLRLVSLFNVLDTRSFLANLQQEGLGITKPPWSSVGAQGVVKGQISGSGTFQVEMRFYEIARGDAPLLTRSYHGGTAQLRGFMHDFANEILRVLTGKLGAFNTKLTFTRKVGTGRKDVYVSDFDGQNQGRISSGKGIAMLSAFGASHGIWYSVLSRSGMFVTNTKSREQPVVTSTGLNMGVTVCGGRVYFSSTRDGNSEIYSAGIDGGDVRRLTNNPAIDISPACGPGGQIAFVSTRHGGPQVFLMSGSGGEPKRITYKGEHNQTPAFCMDADTPMVAFTGREGGAFDIFTVSLKTGQYTRLTQGQGNNQDPTFSPDCRMVAFASSRGGIYISNPEGLNQTKVLSGALTNVRWSAR
jgi:TolB protein